MLKRIAGALKKRLRVDFCAQPVVIKAEVTEFTWDWSIPENWQPKIEESVAAVDPAVGWIPCSQPNPEWLSRLFNPGSMTSLIKA
jgi:hypothetical protein